MTARKALTNAFVKAGGVIGGFVVVFLLLGHFYTPTTTVERGDTSELPHPRADRIVKMIEKHDCWTSDRTAPEGAIPGHAVVTHNGGRLAYVKADEGFAIWLGADLKPGTGDEKTGVIHAFCP